MGDKEEIVMSDGLNYLKDASQYLSFIDEVTAGDNPTEHPAACLETVSHLAGKSLKLIDTVIEWIEETPSPSEDSEGAP